MLASLALFLLLLLLFLVPLLLGGPENIAKWVVSLDARGDEQPGTERKRSDNPHTHSRRIAYATKLLTIALNMEVDAARMQQ